MNYPQGASLAPPSAPPRPPPRSAAWQAGYADVMDLEGQIAEMEEQKRALTEKREACRRASAGENHFEAAGGHEEDEKEREASIQKTYEVPMMRIFELCRPEWWAFPFGVMLAKFFVSKEGTTLFRAANVAEPPGLDEVLRAEASRLAAAGLSRDAAVECMMERRYDDIQTNEEFDEIVTRVIAACDAAGCSATRRAGL